MGKYSESFSTVGAGVGCVYGFNSGSSSLTQMANTIVGGFIGYFVSSNIGAALDSNQQTDSSQRSKEDI